MILSYHSGPSQWNLNIFKPIEIVAIILTSKI